MNLILLFLDRDQQRNLAYTAIDFVFYRDRQYLDNLCKYQFVKYFLCIDADTARRTFSFSANDGEMTSASERLMGYGDPITYTCELKN